MGEGETHRVLGIVAGASGDRGEAERRVEDALAVAVSSRAALLEAEVLELRALLDERQGRPPPRRRTARAEELFATVEDAARGKGPGATAAAHLLTAAPPARPSATTLPDRSRPAPARRGGTRFRRFADP